MRTKSEVRSFTRSIDKRGTQKNLAVPGYANAPFSPKFLMGFCSNGQWTLQMFWPNLQSVALPVPEIIGGT